jgi:hypothetical protein
MWFVSPQLSRFFLCMLHPIGTKAGHCRCNLSDKCIQLDLVFFSAFAEHRLQTAVQALPCSYSPRRKGHSWGLPPKSSSHFMLSGRKCNLYYSTSVQQPTEGHLWVQTLAEPISLGQALSLWPRLKRSARSPGLRLPSADRNLKLSWLASDLFWFIDGIHQVYIYTLYILSYSKTCFLGTIMIELLSCNNRLWTCISSSSNQVMGRGP